MREAPAPPEPVSVFESETMTVESLLASPRPDLPSPMQRLMTPLRRLVLRIIRVYWVQQLGVDRAILAAMRTLRRESRNETAALRQELAELSAEVRALREAGLTSETRDRAELKSISGV